MRINGRKVITVGIALASAFLLDGQTTEQYQLDNGIGFSKFLKSNSPNSSGEYTLRLETFVTGEVEEYSVPNDFVLVLDGSGSMQYDLRVSGYSETPDAIYGDNVTKFGMKYADAFDGLQYYAYNGIYRDATWDSDNQTWSNGQGGYTFPSPFPSDDYTSPKSSRYYYSGADKTYYRIKGGKGTFKEGNNTVTYYYLYFDRTNASSSSNNKRYYVYSNSSGKMTYSGAENGKQPYETVPFFKKVRSASQIIVAPSLRSDVAYTGDADNAWYRHLWRPKQRREVIIEGINNFIDRIAAENADDTKWNNRPANQRHQVAVVSFTDRWNNTSNYTAVSSGISCGTFNPTLTSGYRNDAGYNTTTNSTIVGAQENSTRVLKGFSVINSSNAAAYKNLAKNSIRFSGGASNYSHQGMRLARLLLQNLQSQSNMGPLTAQGSPNRNKIVIFFTDEVTKSFHDEALYSSEGTLSGVSGGTYATFYEAKLIKAVRTSTSGTQINGKVFCIDYSRPSASTDPDTSDEIFLKYLSSNYPDGDYTQKTGGINNSAYSGTLITPESARIYYYNAVSASLTTVFENILTKSDFGTVPSATFGDQIGKQLVLVDQLSPNFVIPSNLDGKVKFYTAQCIGTKTISGGTNNPYLAFAAEKLAPGRESLANLWVGSFDSGGILHWDNKGSSGDGTLADIDNSIAYTVSSDRRTITVNGFNFSDLWCGLDPKHTNTRHSVASSDPNYSNQQDGYRGFKLAVEFPIVLAQDALGGAVTKTNDETTSGVYEAVNGAPTGNPIVTFTSPTLSFPVTLVIQKTGLNVGESASITVQRKPRTGNTDYVDYATFILTGDANNTPEVRLLNLDPSYYYRIKESNWSWSYTSLAKTTFPSTEDPSLTNPITITNTLNLNLLGVIHGRAENKVSDVLQ